MLIAYHCLKQLSSSPCGYNPLEHWAGLIPRRFREIPYSTPYVVRGRTVLYGTRMEAVTQRSEAACLITEMRTVIHCSVTDQARRVRWRRRGRGHPR
jgi:hypothetical protein